jgi:2-polyprenyl-3-methyl-5-hydroxy-6-metoxy-1,4-benzoquinol methylase
MNFSKRSYRKELLDKNHIPFEDIKQNMKELEIINRWLGGHNITIKGIKKILNSNSALLSQTGTPFTVCEIGCGGGDNLKAIDRWLAKKNIVCHFTGIDIKEECIKYAGENCSGLKNINWICADYEKVVFEKKPDIIFSSLFCHHFNEKDIEKIINWMKENAAAGFFINDLQRHPVAYYSIKILTSVFSRSYLVKNDAPLSVLRGLTKKEWTAILQHTAAGKYSLQWQWAFRWLLVVNHAN